jgi:hypothetical protein
MNLDQVFNPDMSYITNGLHFTDAEHAPTHSRFQPDACVSVGTDIHKSIQLKLVRKPRYSEDAILRKILDRDMKQPFSTNCADIVDMMDLLEIYCDYDGPLFEIFSNCAMHPHYSLGYNNKLGSPFLVGYDLVCYMY